MPLVSIHAPVWGATTQYGNMVQLDMFQFTHPVWGATSLGNQEPISEDCFNSRTPCGVRRLSISSMTVCSRFQFTHPVWGATTSK